MKRRANLLLLLYLAASLPSAGQYTVKKSTLTNGSANQYKANGRTAGSIGQPLIGKSSNSDYTVKTGYWAQPAVNVTDVATVTENRPLHFVLAQNFPNPFNSSTTIHFSLAQTSRVSLRIYDITGRELMTLLEGEKQAGEYKVLLQAGSLSSGVFFIRMTADYFSAVRKLLVIK